MHGERAVGLLEPPGPFDRVVEHGRRLGPGSGGRSAGRAAVGIDGRGETIEPVSAAARSGGDVGPGLHFHDPLRGPTLPVAGGPGGIVRQPGRQRHQRPRGLLAGADVVLGLSEQVGDREPAATDRQRRVERDPLDEPVTRLRHAALGEVAEPLVGMTLPHGAPFLDDRDHAGIAGPQFPAHERTAVEEIRERRGGRGPGRQGKLGAEREDAMDHLPRPLHACIEQPRVAGMGEGDVDPPAERTLVGRHRSDGLVGRGSGGNPATRAGDDQGQGRPPDSAVGGNHRGSRCVEHEGSEMRPEGQDAEPLPPGTCLE